MHVGWPINSECNENNTNLDLDWNISFFYNVGVKNSEKLFESLSKSSRIVEKKIFIISAKFTNT